MNIRWSNAVAMIAVLLVSFAPVPGKKIRIFLAGDSTMSKKEIKNYPETGWGMPFTYFFDSTVVVENRAMNGRSTRTFITENRWHLVMEDMRAGDYVLIQFGHNDEVKEKIGSYTTPEEFTSNLGKFITDTRSKQGIPVLLTPVARRNFDQAGNIVGTHDLYSALVRGVAKKYNVPLIDLDKKSQALLQSYGDAASRFLYNWLEPGEHPNYPNGSKDNTHFNELGARKMAELVLADLRIVAPDLAERIVKK